MFWPGSNPSGFHKTPEDPNCLIKEDQCKNNNFFGRHASNGPNVERNFASKGDIHFSIKNGGKFRNTSKGNRVFGVSDKFSKHDVSLTSGKNFGYPKQMHATYRVTKDHNYGINQTPRETPVHCSWRIQCRYLQQQIHAERETNSYQTKIKLSQQSLAELKWWK